MVEEKRDPTQDKSETEETNVSEGGDEHPQKEKDSDRKRSKYGRPWLTMEEMEEESEYSDLEYNEMLGLYEDTLSDISEGEIVKGRILAINDKEVSVDIGFKSEGTIPVSEFDSLEDLNVGEEIEVLLDNVEDKDGQMVLSKKKADFARVWEKIMELHEGDVEIEGRCLRRIKGGIVVDLMGVDAFLPGSQIDVKPIRDFDAYIGQTLIFKIVKVNQLRKNIVVSRRVLIEESQKETREKILEELEKGQVREGSVKNITDFGVFIDLGGVDGLLHITDLSWGRVSHPSEIVSLDQKINVMVLDFDDKKERISLGLKQLLPHPWEDVEEKYPVSKKVKGKVVSITDYGAFVELEKGIEGLIHISEMSWTQHIKHPSKIVSVGQEVEVIVLNVEKDEKKISLGLKQVEPDPWMAVEDKYKVGTRHVGKVRNLTNFGVFVELEEGIDGLVHISDLSWTKKIRHPSEVIKKGDEIDIVILSISRQNRRISLGHKQVFPNPWDSLKEEYKVESETTCKVMRVVDKGAIVELSQGVEGFVPASQLSSKIKKKERPQIEPGTELPVLVIEFDKEQKKIVLSHTAYLQRKEREVVDEYLRLQQDKKEPGSVKEEKLQEAAVEDVKSETPVQEKDVKKEEKLQVAEDTEPVEEKIEQESQTQTEESIQEEGVKEEKSHTPDDKEEKGEKPEQESQAQFEKTTDTPSENDKDGSDKPDPKQDPESEHPS